MNFPPYYLLFSFRRREFYYIQMEKYSRQAIAEGVKNASDLVVTGESELYRVLVLHYNRNNQIEVSLWWHTWYIDVMKTLCWDTSDTIIIKYVVDVNNLTYERTLERAKHAI